MTFSNRTNCLQEKLKTAFGKIALPFKQNLIQFRNLCIHLNTSQHVWFKKNIVIYQFKIAFKKTL